MEHWDAFSEQAGLEHPCLSKVVVAVSQIPYGRPDRLSAEGVLAVWRGTCSTKHVLLVSLLSARWPDSDPTMWHHVYRVTQDIARSNWGDSVAAVVPSDGLMDIHTYMTVLLAGSRVLIDATFPVADWDGLSSMRLWAGSGESFRAGSDPLRRKRELELQHCDSRIREPFIAAIAAAPASAGIGCQTAHRKNYP